MRLLRRLLLAKMENLLCSIAICPMFDLIWLISQQPRWSNHEITIPAGWRGTIQGVDPALDQMSLRRRVLTNNDSSFYAFVKTSPDKAERILVITNFLATTQEINVDLSGILMQGLGDLRTAETRDTLGSVKVTLPGYGYKLFTVR